MVDFGRVNLEPQALTENNDDSMLKAQLDNINAGISDFLEDHYQGAGLTQEEEGRVFELFQEYLTAVSWDNIPLDNSAMSVQTNWWKEAKDAFNAFADCCEDYGLAASRYVKKLFVTVRWLLTLAKYNATVPLEELELEENN